MACIPGNFLPGIDPCTNEPDADPLIPTPPETVVSSCSCHSSPCCCPSPRLSNTPPAQVYIGLPTSATTADGSASSKQSAKTFDSVLSAFTWPPVGGAALLEVEDASIYTAGQTLEFLSFGWLTVASTPTSTSLQVRNDAENSAGNVAAGTSVPSQTRFTHGTPKADFDAEGNRAAIEGIASGVADSRIEALVEKKPIFSESDVLLSERGEVPLITHNTNDFTRRIGRQEIRDESDGAFALLRKDPSNNIYRFDRLDPVSSDIGTPVGFDHSTSPPTPKALEGLEHTSHHIDFALNGHIRENYTQNGTPKVRQLQRFLKKLRFPKGWFAPQDNDNDDWRIGAVRTVDGDQKEVSELVLEENDFLIGGPTDKPRIAQFSELIQDPVIPITPHTLVQGVGSGTVDFATIPGIPGDATHVLVRASIRARSSSDIGFAKIGSTRIVETGESDATGTFNMGLAWINVTGNLQQSYTIEALAAPVSANITNTIQAIEIKRPLIKA